MNILIILGNKHHSIYTQLKHKKSIINKMPLRIDEAIELLQNGHISPDKLIVGDDSLELHLDEATNQIKKLAILFENKTIVFITTRLEVRDILYKLQKENQHIEIEYSARITSTLYAYNEVLSKIIYGKDKKHIYTELELSDTSVQEKKIVTNQNKMSLLKKIFKKDKTDIDQVTITSMLDKRLMGFSKGINRVIAIAGHRGIGCTSTAVNIAYEAANRGLNTILIDMDIKNRSLNLYCGEFAKICEANKDMGNSLIRCLAKPQEYKHSAYCINNKLWVSGLSYDFEDRAVIDRFYTTSKIVNLLTILRQNFNVIVLDLPIDMLSELQDVILHIDVFGLCVSNTLYSVVTTLRNISTYLTTENSSYLNGKSKIIVARYNDRMHYQGEIFTADQVSELFSSDLSDDFNIAMPVAGIIRYSQEFDTQLETDIPIVNSSREFKEYYSNILLRLLEGAR